MVNSEKMSKSKGNFLTLEEAISTYSADATRIACADSGDGLQDANFSTESCGKTILRLTTLQAWAEDAKARLPTMRTGDYTFLDEIFNNEINICLENAHTAYRKMLFTDALRCVWYDLENLRSQYSILTNGDVHAEVVERLLEGQTITLSPIAPHFCENLWRNVLKKDTLVVKQRWPESKEIDAFLARQYALIQGSLRSFRLQLEKFKSPKKKSKEVPPKPTHAIIFVAKNYKPWQMEVLKARKSPANLLTCLSCLDVKWKGMFSLQHFAPQATCLAPYISLIYPYITCFIMGSSESKMKALSECLHINSHHVFIGRNKILVGTPGCTVCSTYVHVCPRTLSPRAACVGPARYRAQWRQRANGEELHGTTPRSREHQSLSQADHETSHALCVLRDVQGSPDFQIHLGGSGSTGCLRSTWLNA